jgi:hypothetical protein
MKITPKNIPPQPVTCISAGHIIFRGTQYTGMERYQATENFMLATKGCTSKGQHI